MTESICPCRQTSTEKIVFEDCCAPILDGTKPAPTAEALMRSRYTAFAVGNIDYLHDSLAPESRHDFDRKAIAHWAKQSQWLGLDILSTEDGRAGASTGYVEFVAHFVNDSQRLAHRERSLFRYDAADSRWYFLEEANRKNAPVVKGAQPGRNDPCACGSGKKYKKCCGMVI